MVILEKVKNLENLQYSFSTIPYVLRNVLF